MEKSELLERYAAGERDFTGDMWQGPNLQKVDLQSVDLRGVVLRRVDFSGACLKGANLSDSDFRGATFEGADLSGANLQNADLSVTGWYGADLTGADLRGATFQNAHLLNVNLTGARLPNFQIEQGVALIGWKKCVGGIAKVRIPAGVRRTVSLRSRKCRAERVEVIETSNGNTLLGLFDRGTVYAQGETVYPDKYDDDIREDCTHGIHFFLTREEAENY